MAHRYSTGSKKTIDENEHFKYNGAKSLGRVIV